MNTKPPVREFLMVDKCREDHQKYQHISNSKGMVRKLDNRILRGLLTIEVERESYDYYANHFTKYNQDDLDEFSKSAERSETARSKGNKLLLKKKHTAEIHQEVWKLYSKSVALAPPDSEELAAAYANRSYLFLHIGQFEESIKDIKRAIDLTNSEELKLKLLCRKMTCLAGLKDSDSQINTWQSIKTLFDTMDETVKDQKLAKLVKKAKCVMTSFHSTTPQVLEKPTLPSHNLVSLRRDENNSEYLVAERNIDPGELVLTLKPYVISANSQKFHAFCSHCTSIMWASIPCDRCSLSMFCSDKCKTEAWEQYHEIECKVIPHMQIELIYYFYYQMAVRSFIMAVKETGNLQNLMKTLEEIDRSTDPMEESSMEHRNSGRAEFMNLYTAPVNLRFDMFVQCLRNTTLILNLFIQTTDIYDGAMKNLTGRDLARDELVISSALLILKLMCLASSHTIHAGRVEGVFCADGKSAEDCTMQRCCARGALLVPGACRVKSACNPNTFHFIKEYESRVVYIAYRPIKKGEMITVAEYGLFYMEKIKERKENMSFLDYECNCKACLEDWPHLEEFTKDLSAPEAPLMPLMLPKYEDIMEKQIADRSYLPGMDILDDLKKDVEKAYRVTGDRPTFLTCLLMQYSFFFYCRRYSIRQPHVPEICYS